MKIERFEDILAWQEGRVLVKMVYGFVKENKNFSSDFKFREQICNSAVSIMANIAEGFSRHSNKELIQFLFIAKGSVAEVQSHLYVALDQRYLSEKAFKEIYAQSDKVAKYISNFISYLLDRRSQHQQTQETSTNLNKHET